MIQIQHPRQFVRRGSRHGRRPLVCKHLAAMKGEQGTGKRASLSGACPTLIASNKKQWREGVGPNPPLFR